MLLPWRRSASVSGLVSIDKTRFAIFQEGEVLATVCHVRHRFVVAEPWCTANTGGQDDHGK